MSLWLTAALIALFSLVLMAWVVARRGIRQQLGYFALLCAGVGWMGWVVQEQRISDGGLWPRLELLAGLFGALLLVGVPALLDRMIRRAFSGEEYARAARLAGARALLVPGDVSNAEHDFFERVAAAREGRADEVVRALRQLLVDAEPPADEQVQEQIVTVLLFAERWRDAATQYETHLSDDPARHPSLTVQLIRAYGALGDLERAAQLLHRLEERLHPADPAAQAVLLQGRLQLLAWAGRAAEVQQLLAHPALKAMPPRMRRRLLDTAQSNVRARPEPAVAAVDPAGSEAPPPAAPTEGPPLEGPDGTAPLPDADGAALPAGQAATPSAPSTSAAERHLSVFLDGVALRAAGDLRARPLAPTRSLPPATMTLIAVNACAYLLFFLLLGSPDVLHNLVRGGASLHAAVRAGEWWRLWTASYLHQGVDHLLLNLYGLFVLGRIVEPVLGTVRFLCVYSVAGLAAQLASVENPNPDVIFALGASGSVLGLMAALMVMLVLRRGAWPEGWRREVLLNLGVLLVIQLAIGAWWPGVDNFLHVGGLLGGAAAGMLLVPGGLLGRSKPALGLVAALLMTLLGSSLWAVSQLLQEDLGETLARLPRARLKVGAASLLLPGGTDLVHDRAGSSLDTEVRAVHPLGLAIETTLLPASGDLDEVLAEVTRRYHEEAQREDRQRGGSGGLRVEGRRAPAVPGWRAVAETLWVDNGGWHHDSFVRAAPPAVLLVNVEYKLDAPPEPLLSEELERALTGAEVDEEALHKLPMPSARAATTEATPAPVRTDGGAAPDAAPAATTSDAGAPPARDAAESAPDAGSPPATAGTDPAGRAPR